MRILRIIFTQVLPELIYLIIRGDKTISVDNYVFVEPIIIDEKWVGKKRITARRNIKYSNAILEANRLNRVMK
jgi:hypothetical protein